MVRRTSHHSYERIDHLLDRIEIVAADLLDQHSLTVVLQDTRPDEVYNLAAQSFVPTSWNQPVLTGEFTALGVTRILEAIRLVHPKARFYQASSSEMFGKVTETPQRETTPFYPRSPYGVAKVYGHWITVNYRESLRPLRRERDSLQPRVAPARDRVRDPQGHRRRRPHQAGPREGAPPRQPRRAARLGLRRRLRRGDVAHAPAAQAAGLRRRHRRDPQRAGAGASSRSATSGSDYRKYVVSDPRFHRPAEVDLLLADPTKARQELGWKPKVSFEQLVAMMVDADLARLSAARATVKAARHRRRRLRRPAPGAAPGAGRTSDRCRLPAGRAGGGLGRGRRRRGAAGAHRRPLACARRWNSAPTPWCISRRSPPTARPTPTRGRPGR